MEKILKNNFVTIVLIFVAVFVNPAFAGDVIVKEGTIEVLDVNVGRMAVCDVNAIVSNKLFADNITGVIPEHLDYEKVVCGDFDCDRDWTVEGEWHIQPTYSRLSADVLEEDTTETTKQDVDVEAGKYYTVVIKLDGFEFYTDGTEGYGNLNIYLGGTHLASYHGDNSNNGTGNQGTHVYNNIQATNTGDLELAYDLVCGDDGCDGIELIIRIDYIFVKEEIDGVYKNITLDPNDYVDVSGDLNVTGDVNVAGDLQIDGNDIGVSGDTDLLQLASGALTVNGAVTATGDLKVDGGDIGISADTDLLQLATNALTVNGVVTATGDLKVDGGDIGITADTDLLQLTANTVTVNGTLAATTVTGANVTSGSDPGHTHTAYTNKDGSIAFTGTGAGFKDEDDMASDSAIAAASQQSIKAYQDNVVGHDGEAYRYIDVNDTKTKVYTKYLTGTMDNDSQTAVAHGCTAANIVNISAIVYDDSSSVYRSAGILEGLDNSKRCKVSYDSSNIILDDVGSDLQGQAYRIRVDYH